MKLKQKILASQTFTEEQKKQLLRIWDELKPEQKKKLQLALMNPNERADLAKQKIKTVEKNIIKKIKQKAEQNGRL